MIGDLQHWQYNTFKAHWRDRTIEDAFVTFALNPGWLDRQRKDGGRVSAGGLQLRLPGLAVEACGKEVMGNGQCPELTDRCRRRNPSP